MSPLIVIGGASILIAPQLIPRERLSPPIGVALWMSVIALRAALMIYAALLFMALAPVDRLIEYLPAWCLHAAAPIIPTHLLSSHAVGDLAGVIPLAALAVSVTAAGFGSWRAARAVARWVARNALGEGPDGSLVVSDSEMILGAAGVRQPVVVVSAGALIRLDERELAAGLQHEWGHLRRGHRFVTLAAALMLGLSWPLPGRRHCSRNLQFHLERDADEYAVRKTQDPYSLASAICKVAAASGPRHKPAFAGLGSSDVADRLRLLIAEERADSGRISSAVFAAAAGLAAIGIVGVLSAILSVAVANADGLHVSLGSVPC